MLRVSSHQDLLDTFRALDRAEVQIPSSFKFPLAVRDYLTWIEPSGHRIYLVFEDEVTHRPLGVVFQRTHGHADTPASMCHWCHAVRSGDGVGLLTAAVTSQRRVGVHLCSDLSCRERALSTPGVHDFRESVSGGEKVRQIMARMNDFAKRNLF
jgi:hypothetical protein